LNGFGEGDKLRQQRVRVGRAGLLCQPLLEPEFVRQNRVRWLIGVPRIRENLLFRRQEFLVFPSQPLIIRGSGIHSSGCRGAGIGGSGIGNCTLWLAGQYGTKKHGGEQCNHGNEGGSQCRFQNDLAIRMRS
jgi:hypothetical protein